MEVREAAAVAKAPAETVAATGVGPDVLTTTGGLQLYLDPRRITDGYDGTGYLGVGNDYQPTGYKKFRPFFVTFDGVHAGRFATVEQAAVCYARLESGMPRLLIAKSADEPEDDDEWEDEVLDAQGAAREAAVPVLAI